MNIYLSKCDGREINLRSEPIGKGRKMQVLDAITGEVLESFGFNCDECQASKHCPCTYNNVDDDPRCDVLS